MEGTNPDLEALAATKATYEKALKATEAAKLAITMAGATPFELYGNSLTRPNSLGKKSLRPM